MTAAAFAGGALLISWSQISALWQLYAISVGIGVVSAMTLYDAAFAVVARMFGADQRSCLDTLERDGYRVEKLILSNTTCYYADKTPWNDRIKTVKEKGLAAMVDGPLVDYRPGDRVFALVANGLPEQVSVATCGELTADVAVISGDHRLADRRGEDVAGHRPCGDRHVRQRLPARWKENRRAQESGRDWQRLGSATDATREAGNNGLDERPLQP